MQVNVFDGIRNGHSVAREAVSTSNADHAKEGEGEGNVRHALSHKSTQRKKNCTSGTCDVKRCAIGRCDVRHVSLPWRCV